MTCRINAVFKDFNSSQESTNVYGAEVQDSSENYFKLSRQKSFQQLGLEIFTL